MYFTNNVLSTDAKTISFEINHVDVSVVNSLRRIILSEIPNVGFFFKVSDHFVNTDIIFHTNNSPLHNEFMAHRFSMLPLCFDDNEIKEWDINKYTFVIDVKNTTQSMMDVTTEHFQILDEEGNKLPPSFVRRIFPADNITKDYILLTKLPSDTQHTDQHPAFKVEAKAQKGIPKDCTAWNSVSTCSFFNTFDTVKSEAQIKILTENKTKDEKKEIIADFKTLQIQKFYKTNEYDEPSSLTMTITTECAITPISLFTQACDVLVESLSNISYEFTLDTSEVVSFVTLNEVPNFIGFTIKGYTHTIGNLIQSLFMNKYVRDEKSMDYVGYSVPHPLEETTLLKIKFTNDMSDTEVKAFMVKSIKSIIDLIDDIKAEWVVLH